MSGQLPSTQKAWQTCTTSEASWLQSYEIVGFMHSNLCLIHLGLCSSPFNLDLKKLPDRSSGCHVKTYFIPTVTCMHAHACMHTHMHAHTHTCTHAHTQSCTHAHTHACMHARTRAHARAHTHTHWRASRTPCRGKENEHSPSTYGPASQWTALKTWRTEINYTRYVSCVKNVLHNKLVKNRELIRKQQPGTEPHLVLKKVCIEQEYLHSARTSNLYLSVVASGKYKQYGSIMHLVCTSHMYLSVSSCVW